MQNEKKPQSHITLKSLSNAKFLRWFFLLNAGLVLTLLWTGPLALFIPLLGFGGAMLSLVFAKWLAKRAHGIRLIDPLNPASTEEAALYAVVKDLSQRAGLERVPDVGIYRGLDLNAFATGMSRKSALIAFSSGLLEQMSEEQIQAITAHEVAHIVNQDMFGMVLLQGVINSIVLAVTLPLHALLVINLFSEERSWFVETMLWLIKSFVALILTFLGTLALKAFSRHREYRADAFAAVLLGKESIISALKVLSTDTAEIPAEQRVYNTFKVSGRASFFEILSTHPPIGKRIIALEEDGYPSFVESPVYASPQAQVTTSVQQEAEEIRPERSVGLLLVLGIILMPYLFSFFTLRKGYSKVSRYFAIGWLGVFLIPFISFQPTPIVSNSLVTPSIQSPSTSQQVSNTVQTSGKGTQVTGQSKLDNGKAQQVSDINKQNGLYTKYGTLTIKNINEDKKGLFIDNKLIFEREYGYLGVEKNVIYHLVDSEVAVIYSDDGGSGTPPSHALLTLTPSSSPKLSDWFDHAFNIEINPVTDGNKITIDLGHSNGNHNILTHQNNQTSIQSLTDKGQNADDDTCDYLYNGIYVEYVNKQECNSLPQSVSGMATERSYNSYENDPRLKLESFQQISNSSCKNNTVIRYSDFKKLVCGGSQPTPVSTSNTSNTQPVDQNTSNEKQLTTTPAAASINEMIASALLPEKRITAQENIEALPKLKRGNRKEARKLNDQSLILAKELNYQGALTLMIDAYNLDSSDVEIINNIGYLQIKTSDLANAKKSLIQTLTLKPNRAGAWADLGSVFTAEGDEESAINCYINYYNYAKNQDNSLKYLNTEDLENSNITRVKISAYNAIKALSSVSN